MMRLARRDLPLTPYDGMPLSSGLTRGLTLSPRAGRENTPCGAAAVEQDGAAYPFSPAAGRRWRQPDEGRTAESAIAPNAMSQEALNVSHS
ncbi:hypothetical protein C7U60_19335 [Mesorhizobium plurifarium]|nr:hypothetical protein C7U60_19335 [Mesorhizobium plurifarium]